MIDIYEEDFDLYYLHVFLTYAELCLLTVQ
jgi:hypothetical protein